MFENRQDIEQESITKTLDFVFNFFRRFAKCGGGITKILFLVFSIKLCSRTKSISKILKFAFRKFWYVQKGYQSHMGGK